MLMTRRQVLTAAALLATAPCHASPAPLTVTRDAGSWRVVNRATGDALGLGAGAPRFEFVDGAVGGDMAGAAAWTAVPTTTPGRRRWHALWRAPDGTEIRALLDVDERRGLVRRSAALRLAGTRARLLRSVMLDAARGAGQAFRVEPGIQSQPALGRSFFAGIEYPIAATGADGDALTLAYRPGRQIRPGAWYHTHTAVYGAAPAGGATRAFVRYIDGLRPAPRGVHFNYNSWWTSPVPYRERDILDLVSTIHRRMERPYGAAPDTVCIDMGWSRADGIWEVDRDLFPRGLAPLARACAGMGAHPGLWVSPSAVYPPALNLAAARRNGFETDERKACLAGSRYRAALERALVTLARQGSLRHVKLDGYVPTCDQAGHGHEPGALSAEPVADGMIRVLRALRAAAPDVWIEPTCFGPRPSPWWLRYCNSVTGSFGDDAPAGRTPCPIYRESYTTARDWYNLQGTASIRLPIAAQEVLGIVHQSPEPLQNDSVMAVLRGHQFLPLYVNPRHMTERRWAFLAALVRWARANQGVLAETVPIYPPSWRNYLESGSGEAPPLREPYGYAHWRGGRGLVCLRNPWIEPARVRLSLAGDLGAAGLRGRVAVACVYPTPASVARRLAADGVLDITMAPYETAVLAIGPASEALTVPPRATAPAVAATARVRATRFVDTDTREPNGPDYTRVLAAPGPRLRVRLDATTRCGTASDLLLLTRAPVPVEAPVISVTLDGRPVPVRLLSSAAGWRATGLPEPEHWAWAVARVPPGRHRVAADMQTASEGVVVEGWLAPFAAPAAGTLVRDGFLPPPERRYLAARRVLGPTRLTDNLPEERGAGPEVRIAGVYLDTLDPEAVSQGWGTLQRNRSVWERPMTLGGRLFRRGLGTHAPARIVYALDGRWRRFRAWAGADQATAPTISMAVRVDGRIVWRAGRVTRETPPAHIDVSVAGARRLELIVGDGDNGLAGDHADWADAMLIR